MGVKAPQPAPIGPKPNPSPPPPPPTKLVYCGNCGWSAFGGSTPSVHPQGKPPPMPPMPPPNETTTKGPLPPMLSRPPDPVRGQCRWCRIKAAIQRVLRRGST